MLGFIRDVVVIFSMFALVVLAWMIVVNTTPAVSEAALASSSTANVRNQTFHLPRGYVVSMTRRDQS
jgi:hypothetical protein